MCVCDELKFSLSLVWSELSGDHPHISALLFKISLQNGLQNNGEHRTKLSLSAISITILVSSLIVWIVYAGKNWPSPTVVQRNSAQRLNCAVLCCTCIPNGNSISPRKNHEARKFGEKIRRKFPATQLDAAAALFEDRQRLGQYEIGCSVAFLYLLFLLLVEMKWKPLWYIYRHSSFLAVSCYWPKLVSLATPYHVKN